MSPFIHIKSDYFKTKFIASLSQREVWRECKYSCGVSAQKKSSLVNCSFSVRIKGLEPPRLSASDPKSDVATNYTISALVRRKCQKPMQR